MKPFGIAPKRAGLTLAVLATAVVVAACGSSSSTTTTTRAASSAAAGSGSASPSRASFRTCLAQHGVKLPNFRRRGTTGPSGPGGPPGGGGGLFFGGGGASGGGAGRGQFSNPKFRAAIQACGGFRGARPGGPRRFQISHTAITNFVACVRKHGFPQMPNPNFGGGAILPSSLRKNPKFVSASKACARELVPRRPATGQTGPGA